MNISVISSVYGDPWAGSEELWYQTGLQCLAHGHNFTASLFKSKKHCSQIENFMSKGGGIHWRNRIRGGRLRNWTIRYSSSFSHIFNSSPDVLIISLGSLLDLCLHPDLIRDVSRYNGRLFVVCLYNSDNLIFTDQQRKIIQSVLLRAEKCIFVSQHNYKLTERQLAVALPSVSVFCSPVSCQDTFEILPWPAESDCFVMSCAARLEVSAKGHDILLESLASEKWSDRNWKLNIYGNGTDRKYIEQLITHYKLSEKVRFKGFVNDTRDIWRCSHLLVMASRAEGLTLAVIEAMICGRACVVTDVGGHSEVITDSITGFIAEAPQAKYFGNALERAWQARESLESIGRRAHESARKVFRQDPVQTFVEMIEQGTNER